MTKPIFITIFLLLFVIKTYSQFNISINTGYSFSTNPIILDNVVIEDNNMDASKASIKHGNGLNMGVGVGYVFSEKLSLNINSNTQLYTKSEFGNDSYYVSGIHGDYTYENRNIQISPLLVYYYELDKLKLFVKAGFNILYSKNILSHNYHSLHVTDDFMIFDTIYNQYLFISKGGINLGFKGAIGLQYPIFQNTSLYFELISVNTNYSYKETETTKYIRNGEDKLSSLEEEEIKIQYEDAEGIVDYSHAGIQIGLIYTFSKK